MKKNQTFLIFTVLAVIIFIIQLVFHSDKKFDHCICNDGTISYSHGSGACSHHGGVSEEIYVKTENDLDFGDVFIALIATPFITLIIWFLILFFISIFKK